MEWRVGKKVGEETKGRVGSLCEVVEERFMDRERDQGRWW